MTEYFEIRTAAVCYEALMAALKVGLIEALDTAEPKTVQNLEQKLDVPKDTLSSILNVLEGLDIVTISDDQILLTGKITASRDCQSFLDLEQYSKDLPIIRENLKTKIATKPKGMDQILETWSTAPMKFYSTEGEAQNLSQYLKSPARLSGLGTAEEFSFESISKIVDLGGNDGSFVCAICSRVPHLKGVVADLPYLQEIARKNIEELGLEDRVQFESCDFLYDDLPPSDCYSMGFILHDWPREANLYILKKIYDSLTEGGLLILNENFIDHPDPKISLTSRASGFTLVSLGLGGFGSWGEKSTREYQEILAKIGFKKFEVKHSINKSRIYAYK
ncbi:MAG: methyltransferase [Pseudomonadota bacterium]